MRIIPVIMLFITLLFKNDTYCTPYEGILLFKILLQVVAVWLIALNCLTCAPTLWSSNFVDHLYDYRPNCTPLSLITIINQQGSKKKDYLSYQVGKWKCFDFFIQLTTYFVLCNLNYGDHLTIEGCQKVIFWKFELGAWSPAWMYLAKH